MMINANQQITLLDLIDYVVTEGKMPLFIEIASKDFISVLITLMKSNNNPEVNLKSNRSKLRSFI